MLNLPTILKQAEAATKGPWRSKKTSYAGHECEGGDWYATVYDSRGASLQHHLHTPTAEFIAAARTNVPMLVAALTEAQTQLEIMTHKLEILGYCGPDVKEARAILGESG